MQLPLLSPLIIKGTIKDLEAREPRLAVDLGFSLQHDGPVELLLPPHSKDIPSILNHSDLTVLVNAECLQNALHDDADAAEPAV